MRVRKESIDASEVRRGFESGFGGERARGFLVESEERKPPPGTSYIRQRAKAIVLAYVGISQIRRNVRKAAEDETRGIRHFHVSDSPLPAPL